MYITQRDYMRALVNKYGVDNHNKIIGHYAKAEKEGKVHRKRNRSNLTAIEYAFHLYHDMITKGWHK